MPSHYENYSKHNGHVNLQTTHAFQQDTQSGSSVDPGADHSFFCRRTIIPRDPLARHAQLVHNIYFPPLCSLLVLLLGQLLLQIKG